MPAINFPIRLDPGNDLRVEIERVVRQYQIQAGWIVTGVGSLSTYALRFANQSAPSVAQGHFEIVSLAGTLSINGCHLHISLSDHTGAMLGGHLLEGCVVYTTAEVIIAADQNFIFERESDTVTGWKELKIGSNKNSSK
jgi:predicted DNA-binding protein with PD1-like motif